LEIEFSSSYVGDSLEWNVKGSPKKGYKVIGGENTKLVEIDTKPKSKSKTKSHSLKKTI